MCKGLIGEKIGMTSLFLSNGDLVPVTVVRVGPCVVTQIKTEATDGYNALQVGFGTRKIGNINKPLGGHLQKSDTTNIAILREFSVAKPQEFDLGQTIKADLFSVGEHVAVTGTTKGRGFSGVIKRHGFHGGKDTHGSHSHRVPGSIGCSAWPAKVIKGKKMPGQYGNQIKTVKNLEIIDIRPEENLVMIKGALPGSNDSIVMVRKM